MEKKIEFGKENLEQNLHLSWIVIMLARIIFVHEIVADGHFFGGKHFSGVF